MGILTAYLALSFLEETLEGALHMPSWVLSLSIFHLYGNPIFLGMTGAAIALLVIGLVQFRSADIALGSTRSLRSHDGLPSIFAT